MGRKSTAGRGRLRGERRRASRRASEAEARPPWSVPQRAWVLQLPRAEGGGELRVTSRVTGKETHLTKELRSGEAGREP